MKVLLVGSEVAPIIKLGGLGDVMGSLPKALEKLDINVDVIVPYYPVAKTENLDIYKQLDLEVPFGGESILVEVHKTKLPKSNVDVFLLRNARYFSIGGQNAFANNISETEMFAFFNRAVAEFIKAKFNTYDLIHCNDWHTGLLTHILEDEIGSTRPATLITIHNLAYQGIGNAALVQDLGFIPGDHPLIDWDTEDGDLNMMQQGLASCDYLNTVSESYAKEILFKDMGGAMTEILQAREARLVGILNGLDYEQFPRDYDLTNWQAYKRNAKKQLQQFLGLEVSEKPMFGFITRLDPNQKGLDIMYDNVYELVKQGGQFVLLGTGDKVWEGKFTDLGNNPDLKGNISINLKFDVTVANNIYKGSDFFFVPSRYEPCGLTQMISMYYGSLPIVHAVGGLKDSVTNNENGFSFQLYAATDLKKSISDAFNVIGTTKHQKMVENAMRADFSWDKSAKKYKELYTRILEIRKTAINLAQNEHIASLSNSKGLDK